MQPKITFHFVALLLGSSLFIGTACTIRPQASRVNTLKPTAANEATKAIAPSSPITPTPPAATPTPDPYQQALQRASSAATVSQSAQSRDDWTLAANRWQQAIALLSTLPSTHPNHAQSQNKLAEYRRNLTYAQQQANRPRAPEPSGVIAIAPQPPARSAVPPSVRSPIPAISNTQPRSPVALPANPSPVATATGRIFQAPILRREGGTPVISVTFNHSQSFDMVVDTGASGTLITQNMARSLGVVPVGRARIDTASAQAVEFPLGYVPSIQVGEVIANNVLVAIAAPGMPIGLLGHDFFGNYDITIRQEVVEFRER